MSVLNVSGRVYGKDSIGQRWSLPVASVSVVCEVEGQGVYVWVGQTFMQAGMPDDTLESVYEAIYGSTWPSNAP